MTEAAQDPNPDQPPERPAPQRPPFSRFLMEQRRGGLHGELTDALAEVVRTSHQLGKPGSVTLKIDVRPDNGTVFITDTVSTKIPQPKRKPHVYFPDEAGGLHRSNPAQPSPMSVAELPPREAPRSLPPRDDRKA